MSTDERTSITLYNQEYGSVISTLEAVYGKFNIKTLKITFTSILELKTYLTVGFDNLTDLELSNCDIYMFADNVFENLINLKVLNLSNNAIFSIEDSLFRTNNQLEMVILKNNLLNSINEVAFSNLKCLEILDLSFNSISVINENCLNCLNLSVLYLSYNNITNIAPTAFQQLPNLMNLTLERNEINCLNEEVFHSLLKLRHLNLSYNKINAISDIMFKDLISLRNLNLKNNVLRINISRLWFVNCHELYDINMSNCHIYNVGQKAFMFCANLMFLNMTVMGNFEISSIKNLQFLIKFKLVYKTEEPLRLLSNYWLNIKYNKNNLAVLILIIQKIDILSFTIFSELKNLNHIHVECKEPRDIQYNLKFYLHFNGLTQLNKLILKRLNRFTVSNLSMDYNNLKYFDLVGVENFDFKFVFVHFRSLVTLNLSYSQINEIGWDVFRYLVKLEHLDLSYTKIKVIFATSFVNNRKLRFLNCSNCRLVSIEDGSFQNLRHLSILDLSRNYHLNVSENIFSVLRNNSCVILL